MRVENSGKKAYVFGGSIVFKASISIASISSTNTSSLTRVTLLNDSYCHASVNGNRCSTITPISPTLRTVVVVLG